MRGRCAAGKWALVLTACAAGAPADRARPLREETDSGSTRPTADSASSTPPVADSGARSDTAAPTDTGPAVPPWPEVVNLAGAPATWRGQAAGDWAGRVARAAGDQDGDGLADVLVTALWHDQPAVNAGAAYVVSGQVRGTRSLGEAWGTLLGEAEGDALGVSADLAGDLNGDGRDDLVLGADGHDAPRANAGVVYLVHGPVQGVQQLPTSALRLWGERRGDLAGVSVAGVGDQDGDGLGDVWIGARYFDAGSLDAPLADAGIAYLVPGPGREGSLAQAPGRLIGEAAGDWLGLSVSRAGDLNGDGLNDLLVGAPYVDGPGAADAGAVYVWFGPLVGEASASEADARWLGVSAGDEACRSAGGGDADGDGYGDWWAGARGQDGGAPEGGAAYLILGPGTGRRVLHEASTVVYGVGAGDDAGFRLDHGGDVDGDGRADALIAAWRSDATGPEAGEVFLIFGTGPAGVQDLDEAGLRLQGAVPGGQAGSNVGFVGDVDGDGRTDLAIGASLVDGAGLDSGEVYLVTAAWLAG